MSTTRRIPILNIYYMLGYAWDVLDESQQVQVSESDHQSLIELLTRVLLSGAHHLFKRGLDRGYVAHTEKYPGIKGKIDFHQSISRDSISHGYAICHFDEFTADVLPNQLIKSTLARVFAIDDLKAETRKDVKRMLVRLPDISTIRLAESLFDQVRIHRNNAYYRFVLEVCRLIVSSTTVNETDGRILFRSFVEDERKMARLFENFVRNFYRRNLPADYWVGREDIRWNADGTAHALSLLPKMQTDVSITSPSRKVVLETKCYATTLSSYQDSTKLHSVNLYQLYSYLRNLESKPDPLSPTAEGILLYPRIDRDLDETYEVPYHRMKVCTVDLSADWRQIERRLLEVLDVAIAS